jgi:mono/diheme cytochrome c family protein
MKIFLAGFVVGIAALLLVALCFISMGGMPVATQSRPLPMEKFLSKMALHAAMKGELDRASPVDASEANLAAGAKIYRVQCAVCHGLPDQPVSAIAQGMFPRPPFLMPPKKGVTDDPVGEIYWKAKNGIRLTGMPGFANTLSDQELWQLSQFLHNAHELPQKVLETLRQNSH